MFLRWKQTGLYEQGVELRHISINTANNYKVIKLVRFFMHEADRIFSLVFHHASSLTYSIDLKVFEEKQCF